MSKASILFDLFSAQPSGSVKFHGGGEYIKSVFMGLVDFNSALTITVCYDSSKFIDNWILETIDSHQIECISVECFDDIYELLNTGEFDSFFCGLPYWIEKEKITSSVSIAGTIHGLRSIECLADKYSAEGKPFKSKLKAMVFSIAPDLLRNRYIRKYKKSIEAMNFLFTDSYHSKYAIQQFYGKSDSVIVAYPPEKIALYDECATDLVETPFILLVSCDRWEKNPRRAILVLDDLFDAGFLKETVVICCGMSNSPYKKYIKHPEHYICLDYVDVEVLEWLYKHCKIFYYPTLNEGFGYPPLEAMKYGTTCVVSSVCSLPEICGDAVYYVNPYDLVEMKTRVLQAYAQQKEPDLVKKQSEVIRIQQSAGLVKIIDVLSSIKQNT